MGQRRRKKWESSPCKRVAREHAVEEIKLLRAEILDIKGREIVSERFFSGGAIAIYLAYGKKIITESFFLLIPVIFSVFGLLRFREYQRNMLEIDCYLREIECALRDDRGWVHAFFYNRSMNRYLQSREWFWYLVGFLCLLLSVLAWTGLFEATVLEIKFGSGSTSPPHIPTSLPSPAGR